jgi:chromate transporter
LADELLSNIPRATVRRTNAAVVGILGAALYNLVWTSAVLMPRDFALALTGCLLLTVWKMPPWIVVVLLAAAGTRSALALVAAGKIPGGGRASE